MPASEILTAGLTRPNGLTPEQVPNANLFPAPCLYHIASISLTFTPHHWQTNISQQPLWTRMRHITDFGCDWHWHVSIGEYNLGLGVC